MAVGSSLRKMFGPIAFTALIFSSYGPELASADELFALQFPCVTLLTVTFHWMTLLMLVLLGCCCCSPCCLCLAAYFIPDKTKGGLVSPKNMDLPPPPREEEQGLLDNGYTRPYTDVFPAELRRAAPRPPTRPPSRFGAVSARLNWGGCCFCSVFVVFILGALIIPLHSLASYKLFDQIMMDMSYPSPLILWVLIVILSTLAACAGLPSIFTRTEGIQMQVSTYGSLCIGAIVLILAIWGHSTSSDATPHVARASNEICRSFNEAGTRPAVCGAVVNLTKAAERVSKASLYGRLLFTSGVSEAPMDIDLDKEHLQGGFLSSLTRRLASDPAHDGAASYLNRLLAGGSYCVDTSQHSAAWTAPTYDQTSFDGAQLYLKSITTSEGCARTEELCDAPDDFNENTSCACNGGTQMSQGKLIGGHCNLWRFGDAAAWCYVSPNVQNCGKVTAPVVGQNNARSSGPCDNDSTKVVMRSKALATGRLQFIGVLVLAVLLAISSCALAIVGRVLNQKPKERRYHEDNSLSWSGLVSAKPQNAKMWEVLGWSEASWDGDDPARYPSSEGKSWEKLSRQPRGQTVSEQQAASFLGFDSVSWNIIPEAGEGAIPTSGNGGDVAQDDAVETQLADQFFAWQEEASKRIVDATPEMKRLEIYGFYHQAVQGNVTGLRPVDEEEQKKYDAWYRNKGMMRGMAMKKYVDAAKELPIPAGSPQASSWR